jgi:diaminohydroxyphosphoribosylaminopyrimidine deaminase / 5-amino-6-(5-phosphoribosylamino)uracil reductase
MSGERFMAEALALAERGRGFVSPNPMVGAVLVKGRRIVGRGWHRRFGGPHAEVEAIRDAGSRARGSTLHVTMEPCCFCGKTPACTNAVAEAGVSRVVAATRDPNPRVNGRGFGFLRRLGVPSEVGMLAGAARRLNEAYFTFVREARPFVLLKTASTLDGMVADAAGRSKWITGTEARRRGQELRLAADAIVVGIHTVLKDDPALTCGIAPGKKLVRVVLDSSLRMPAKCRMLREPGPVLVFTAGRTSTKRLRPSGVEVVSVPKDKHGLLSWRAILGELYRRQLMTVLLEGGATVAASALDAGIVDKVCAFVAPKVLGPGKSFSGKMVPRHLASAIELRQVEHVPLGSDILVQGYVHRTR